MYWLIERIIAVRSAREVVVANLFLAMNNYFKYDLDKWVLVMFANISAKPFTSGNNTNDFRQWSGSNLIPVVV